MEELKNYIVLDLETTGLDPKTGAEIMEFGAVKVEDKKIVEEYETLLKTKGEVPVEIEYLTGIKNADLEGAPSLEEKREEIKNFIGDLPIVGHNISFDTGFLRHYGFDLLQGEIDTCTLASCLVQDIPSYSLGTLADFFDLPKEVAHRAIGDVRMTYHLLEKLRRIGNNLPKEVKEKIAEVGEKYDFIATRLFIGESEDFVFAKKEVEDKNNSEIILPEELNNYAAIAIPEDSERKVVEGLQEKWEAPVLVVARNEHEAFSIAGEEENGVAFFHPGHYLNREKFESFEKNLSKDEGLLYFWLKIIIWQSKTETGSSAELSLRGKDWSYWHEISDSEGNDFYQKAEENIKDKDFIFTNLFSVQDSPEQFKNFENVIILGGETLDFRLGQAAEKRFSSDRVLRYLENKKESPSDSGQARMTTSNPSDSRQAGMTATEKLINQVTLWAGVASTLIQERNLSDKYPSHQPIDSYSVTTPEYARAKEASLNLAEKLEKTGDEYLKESAKDLRDFFNIDGSKVYWAVLMPDGTLNLHSNVINAGEVFDEMIKPKERENVVLLSEHFFKAVMAFITQELGLDSDIWQITHAKEAEEKEKTMSFSVPDELPKAGSYRSEKELQGYVREILTKEKRPTLFVFSARKILNDYFENLFEDLHKAEYEVVAEGRTGGMGKNLAKFDNSECPVFFVSERSFRRISPSVKSNLRVMLHKLPFEWANPLNQARSKKYHNDFECFSIPQALLKFDQILVKARHLCSEKGEFICLDRRMIDKSYGDFFKQVLDYRNGK